MELNFTEEPGFEKSLKKYFKKYLTIYEDLEIFREILIDRYLDCGDKVSNIVSKHTNILTSEQGVYVIKDRMMCRALKGSSLRVVHIYHKNENKIIFLELFYKGDKENEDKELYQSKLVEILKDL